MRLYIWALCFGMAAGAASAETLTLEPQKIIEWKSVYGRVEPRLRVPARARIGGVVISLDVSEGDKVEAGQTIAKVADEKLAFELASFDAQKRALQSRLSTAQSDLERAKTLFQSKVITSQRLDQLQTAVDVVEGEIRSLESQRRVVQQRVTEGEVLSPAEGVVLSAPISAGSVITPGETVAAIGGDGVFLRLSVPERHAGALREGAEIEIEAGGERRTGKLVKLYPEIEGGRVQADVEVEGLDQRFVGRRVPVYLPVGEREAFLVPQEALSRRGGLDFVTVETEGGGRIRRTVVPGAASQRDGKSWREILTGLDAGDRVVVGDE